MKNTYILLTLIFLTSLCSAQTNGINYKAVIKDNNGNVVTNQSLDMVFTIRIQNTSAYSESQQITTDDNGIAIAVIGAGSVISGSFNTIDWKSGNAELNVQIDSGDGLVDMGNSEFNTVPYAIQALTIEALERVTENGNTGWRLATSLAANHGPIGDKALDFSYQPSPIDNAGATGELSVAFGRHSQALGYSSFAMGFAASAGGEQSFSFGEQTRSPGDFSVAMGFNGLAGGTYSATFGRSNLVFGDYAFAIGGSNQLSSDANYSFVGGEGNFTSGFRSFIFGNNNNASNNSGNNIIFGSEHTLNQANYNLLLGYGNDIDSSAYSGIFGSNNTISWSNSAYVLGSNNAVDNGSGLVVGTGNELNSYSSTVMGNLNTTQGNYSFVSGQYSQVDDLYGVAIGSNVRALGYNSFAAGSNTRASSGFETVFGRYNTLYSGNNVGWTLSDRLFVIGNGTSSQRSNAVTILKNGNTGIGTDNPVERLHIANGRLRIGSETIEDGGSNILRFNASLIPDQNGAMSLGNSSLRWTTVYANNGTINTSDRREKKNIKHLNYGLKEILQMQPVSFNWKNKNTPDTKLGLIAQDVLELIPEVVKTHEWIASSDDENAPLEKIALDRLGVYYSDLIPVLINAIKEQQLLIDSQKKDISELKSEITSIKDFLTELKGTHQ